jgi:hypothetical protein
VEKSFLKPYRFVFFSTDRSEPRHIHVIRDAEAAKFWLDGVALAKTRGFSDHQLNVIEGLVFQHQHTLREAWDDYFGSRD